MSATSPVIRRYFAINGECDCPEVAMVCYCEEREDGTAKVTHICRDKNRVRKPEFYIVRATTPVPVSRFGVRLVMDKDGDLGFEQVSESTATYSDGVPRKWQMKGREKWTWPIFPKMLPKVVALLAKGGSEELPARKAAPDPSKPKERPILFKGAMSRAIRERRKRMTRRVIKPVPPSQKEVTAKSGSGFSIYTDRHNPDFFSVDGPVWAVRELTGMSWPKWVCPYGKPGDRLWVRETWYDNLFPHDREELGTDHVDEHGDRYLYFRADGLPDLEGEEHSIPWRSSLHMPRWVCRTELQIGEVRAEPLQTITREDAIAEGLACLTKDDGVAYKYGLPDLDGLPFGAGWPWEEWETDPIVAFAKLWDSINAKPKPMYIGGKIDHYVSYPWEDVRETRTYRGKPWLVVGNPWVWVISFEAVKLD